MAYDDFRDKLRTRREAAEKTYEENSDEAWSQIKSFFTDPANWMILGIVLLLFAAGVFGIKFLLAVRAPTLPAQDTAVPATSERISWGEKEEEELIPDVFDESSVEQPLLTGARKEGYYTFLLFGTDKEGTNTDTIMVVSYDVENQKLSLMSIPRDTMVNVSWDLKKINSVYSRSGVKGMMKHVGKLIGFVPDYYVRIDLQAFVDVVNLLGGVEYDVPVPMHYHDPYQDLSIDLEPGLQTLDGEQAMGLVRFRKSDRGSNGKISGYDDTGRVATQQAFLKVMFKQCLQIKNWTKITSYVEIFEKNVESDLTLGNMLWFARQAMNLSEDGFMTCTIPGNYYASAWSRSTGGMQSYVTLYPQQVVKLVNESFNPYLSKVTTANLDIMSINSDGSLSSTTGYVADGAAAVPPARNENKEETDEDERIGEEENNDEENEDGNSADGSGGAGEGTGRLSGGTAETGRASGTDEETGESPNEAETEGGERNDLEPAAEENEPSEPATESQQQDGNSGEAEPEPQPEPQPMQESQPAEDTLPESDESQRSAPSETDSGAE